MTEYKIEIWGSEFKISADFSQASHNIKVLTEDGIWESTRYQVADFCHCAKSAMERLAEETLCYNDWANEKENKRDIKSAIEGMETEIDLED